MSTINNADREVREWINQRKSQDIQPNVELTHAQTVGNRLLLKARNHNRTVFFGVKVDDEYPNVLPKFMINWYDEKITLFDHYLKERISRLPSHSITALLSNIEESIVKLDNLLPLRQDKPYTESTDIDILDMKGMILQGAHQGGVSNIIYSEEDKWIITTDSDVDFHIDLMGYNAAPKIWIEKPYVDVVESKLPILISGLVALNATANWDPLKAFELIPKLVKLSKKIVNVQEKGTYEKDLLSVHYEMIARKVSAATLETEVSEKNFSKYGCYLPESMVVEAIAMNSMVFVEISSYRGVKICCSILGVSKKKVILPQEIARDLVILSTKKTAVQVRLVTPPVATTIGLRDTDDDFYRRRNHDDIVAMELKRYQVLTYGSYMSVDGTKVVVNYLVPSPYASIVKIESDAIHGTNSAAVEYYRPYSQNDLRLEQSQRVIFSRRARSRSTSREERSRIGISTSSSSGDSSNVDSTMRTKMMERETDTM